MAGERNDFREAAFAGRIGSFFPAVEMSGFKLLSSRFTAKQMIVTLKITIQYKTKGNTVQSSLPCVEEVFPRINEGALPIEVVSPSLSIFVLPT